MSQIEIVSLPPAHKMTRLTNIPQKIWRRSMLKMNAGILAFGALLMVSACGGSGGIEQVPSAPQTPEYQKIKISNATLQEVRGAVRKKLKDPSSAKFGPYRSLAYTEVETDGISKIAGQKVTAVCGKINAKNSYGGYTGEKLFLAEKRDDENWRVYSDRFGTLMCSSSGFDVTVGGDFID